ncbi:MAG TPA: hypothetical protein VHV29_10840 [Terriglobales bacterium]|nr:hypothetical protein [Terriglobales bacterium]
MAHEFSYLVVKVLWVFSLVLQGAIALSMPTKRLVLTFPIFFAYTVLEVFTQTALLFFDTRGNRYALIYWYSEAVAVLLGLLIIFEVLRHILPPARSPRFVTNSVWILTAITAVVALLLLVSAKPGAENEPSYDLIIRGERSVRFLQASLLIMVTALMSRLGLSWHDKSVGIATGFGVYSALALVAYEFGPHLHFMSSTAMSLLNGIAYTLAVIIWAIYLLPSRSRLPIEYLPKFNLAEWNNVVGSYINQWYRRY